MKTITMALLLLTSLYGCKETPKEKELTLNKENVMETGEKEIKVVPIDHATAVLEWGAVTIYVDPVGGAAAFEGQKKPDLILVTDIHGDHFDLKTLQELQTANATIIVPKAVAEKLPEDFEPKIAVMDNGETAQFDKVTVTAIPMYNLREEALQFHTKGRGNGYVLTLGEKRVYFSGDTEDIPEMRQLKDIDMAFICMNLPYTMTVESAADAVLEFKPVQVYPYHYRGRPEVSDVSKFKELLNGSDPEIEVVQLDWYPNDPH